MTDLRKLSEAEWADTPGMPEYIRAATECYSQYRSGSLIPRSEYERVLALLAEAREAFGAVLALEGNTSPFGGELMRDRIERTLERARATLSRIDDALAAEREARG